MKLYLKSLLIIGVITVIGVGGYFVWQYLQTPKEAVAKEAPTAEELLARSFDTEEITTNFKDGGFIKSKFKIVTTTKDQAEDLNKLGFQVESTIIQYINEINKDSVNQPDGIMAFEDNIKTELNKELHHNYITRVYIIEKIVQ